MAVAFDNTIATVLFNRRANIPIHPDTGEPIEFARERIGALVKKLEKDRTKIIIPTPVVAELLTVSGPDGIQYFDTIAKSTVFQPADFDMRAALEVSFMNASALAAGDKKDGIDAPWQKLKVDRQIIAICKVNGVTLLYTDDSNLRTVATRAGLATMGIHELPIPEASRQIGMFDYEARQDEGSEDGET